VTYVYSPLEIVLRADCETGRAIGSKYNPKHPGEAPTGEPYREIYSKGWAISEAQAFEDARVAFHDYAKDRPGKLYWRVRPEIAEGKGGWKYYMRLLISEKPDLS
jgi:hypothetical protein